MVADMTNLEYECKFICTFSLRISCCGNSQISLFLLSKALSVISEVRMCSKEQKRVNSIASGFHLWDLKYTIKLVLCYTNWA